MSSFEHHRQNGLPVLRPLTTRPRIDRISTPNVRTKYKGEGITLGANVTGAGRPNGYSSPTHYGIRGQVWCQARPYSTGNKGYWWVVDDSGHAWIMHESSMELTGQCGSAQGELFEERTA